MSIISGNPNLPRPRCQPTRPLLLSCVLSETAAPITCRRHSRGNRGWSTPSGRIPIGAGDYGSANLNWVVNDKNIAPYIPEIDKSKREVSTFSREDFTFCKEGNVHICPAFNILTTTGKIMHHDMLFYRASMRDCVKARCCPSEPARKNLTQHV